MIDVAKMIYTLRKERGWTQAELAGRLHCTKSVISHYETGKRQPNYEMLEAMADVFNVPIGFLISDEDRTRELLAINGRVPTGQPIPVTAIVSLPVVGTVRCGPGGLAYQDVEGYVQAANVKHPDECFYLRVTGDSMEPQITEGDLALVRRQPEVESGELAVVVVDREEGTLKKVLFKDGAVILQAFNPKYPPRVFTGEAINSLTIVGKVLRTEKEW